jgi:glycine hydroxymethyltransferase
LNDAGVPVFAGAEGFTTSHQFAVEAAAFDGGQTASKKLRENGFLACGIGLPVAEVAGDMNGLRLGTPELVRWGMSTGDAARLAELIHRGLTQTGIAAEVSEWRQSFNRLCFMHHGAG